LRVLITRPEADALDLQATLLARGYEVLIEPLLVIEPVPHPPPDLADVQALVLTSANAAAALTPDLRQLPVFAVGEATAEAARAAGASAVVTAGGRASTMPPLIAGRCQPEAGAILHLAGEVVRPGLETALAAQGFRYRREVVYRARARERFSAAVIAAWQEREIGAVLLFSPRTARILVDLMECHALFGCIDSITALCLSQEAAAPLRGHSWRAVRIAAAPTTKALLERLEGV
jgi:uroporphyrinogen-III synthase